MLSTIVIFLNIFPLHFKSEDMVGQLRFSTPCLYSLMHKTDQYISFVGCCGDWRDNSRKAMSKMPGTYCVVLANSYSRGSSCMTTVHATHMRISSLLSSCMIRQFFESINLKFILTK
jgi:hypothetical protein